MPAYNGARWIAAALESLLNQTFCDFELIISDNASTDNTQEICRRYCDLDGRIRYVRQLENIGVFSNYDLVFHEIESVYFKWASANDLCMPNFLETCIGALEERENATMAHTQTVLFDDSKQIEKKYTEKFDLELPDPVDRYREFWDKIGLNNIMNGVIRSDALRRTSLNKVFHGSDLNMTAELVLLGPVIVVDEFLFYRRMDELAATSARSAADQAAFFSSEPVQTDRYQLSKRLLFGAYGAFMAPRSPGTKLRAFIQAVRMIFWRRQDIWREIVAVWRS